MDSPLIILVTAVLACGVPLAVTLVRTVRADGLGHRPPPPRVPGPEGGR